MLRLHAPLRACILLACISCVLASRSSTVDSVGSSFARLSLAASRSSSNGANIESSRARSDAAAQPGFQPSSPYALPSVAIIGTAKAGTTDLYSLLVKTSRQAPGSAAKRVKEAKLLVEDGVTLVPGHADFHTYLQRIGHPCAGASDPARHPGSLGDSNASYTACVRNLAQQQHPQQQPLTIDATPMYLACPHKAAAALKALSPDTKVIVLLREPVDRAESLYNHRADTEAKRHLPVRVSNLTLDQWGDAFLRWADSAPSVKPLLDSLAAESNLDVQAQLYRQLVSADGVNLLGLPPGPLSFARYNRQGSIERNIFGSALYGPALAAWRAAYFQPGRVMVIDAHHFFRHRLAVASEAFEFIYGRRMPGPEARIVQRAAVQNARRAQGIRFQGARLDGAVLQRLQAFYAPFTEALLNTVLPALKHEGARVVGFDAPPWVPAVVV